MAIFQQCPICRKKQSLRNKICSCGQDLDKAKRSGRIKYWVHFRVKVGGKHLVNKWECVGTSISDARDIETKRKRIRTYDRNVTFNELAEWYLGIERVKALSSFWVIELCLKKFNTVFGNVRACDISPVDLENYQQQRLKAGKAPATIDHEIGKTRTMIHRAFENNRVDGEVVATFKRVKKLLKRGSDVRDRVLSPDEYRALVSHCSGHLRAIVQTAYLTGMRRGEILGLTWDRVDLKGRVIQLEAADTKSKEARRVPVGDALFKVLAGLPRGLHDEHVFLFRGSPVKDIRTGLRKACKAAGIEYGRNVKGGFVFHDLRRCFNTNMRKAGVPESVIMAITGHSTREMFDRYNTVDAADTRKAADQLEVFLANVSNMFTTKRKKPS